MSEGGPLSINLFLVDDHALFRQGLSRVLESEPDFEIVGQCATAPEALAQLPSSGTTMILLDIDLGADRALDFVLASRKQGYDGQILVVTAGVSSQEAIQVVQAGVAGILHKHQPVEVLCDAIRQVAAGGTFLEMKYLTPLFRALDRTKTPKQAKLTERDKTVLRLIFQGLSNREISLRLQISESGVKSAVRQLFDKLAVRTRSQLVKVALEQFGSEL